jgi:hypothetical protein
MLKGGSDVDAKSEQTDARLAALVARFGSRLSSDEVAAIRKSVEASIDLGAALREADIDDDVEPSLYPAGE